MVFFVERINKTLPAPALTTGGPITSAAVTSGSLTTAGLTTGLTTGQHVTTSAPIGSPVTIGMKLSGNLATFNQQAFVAAMSDSLEVDESRLTVDNLRRIFIVILIVL